MQNCQVTIVMPCLNEAETLAACIRKSLQGLKDSGVTGEVLVADNGSTDGSIEIAEREGVRVVHVKEKGYGNALRGGIADARGQWVIMGDADDSYDFSRITGFIERLKAGADLVMGCRMPRGGGTIMPGAMPWKNRYIGNPSLSFIGRLFFKTPIQDFHCGLRGFSKAAYDRMDLKTTGMEFASEMVMKATLARMRVEEVPITLHKDGRSRPPHLKPWRDGWRHLRFMLIYSPRWLFLVPGLVLALVGAVLATAIYIQPMSLGGVRLDTGAFAVACAAMVAGVQLVSFACITKVFAIGEGLLPDDPRFSRVFRLFTLERGLIAGLIALLVGFGLLIGAVLVWREAQFGDLPYAENMRRVIAATTFLLLGVQLMAVSFLMSILGLRTTSRRPPQPAPVA
jgi:hypothetical protein